MFYSLKIQLFTKLSLDVAQNQKHRILGENQTHF